MTETGTYASLPADIRDGHPYHMYDEIRAQPAAVGRGLALAEAHAAEVVHLIGSAARVFLIGCGTSLHAAQAGAWMFRMFTRGRMDVRAMEAFELATYQAGLRSGDVVVAVSHSGETLMVRRAVRGAQEAGARTVVVTGFPERVESGSLVVPTGFPEERSWAHTASYVSALTALAFIANAVSHPNERLDLAPLPEIVHEALQLEELAHRLAAGAVVVEQYAETPPIAIVGGGPNSITAREGVLKLLETSYVQAQAYELEFMLHGPLAALTSETLLIIVAPQGQSVDRAAQLARAALEIGVTPMVLVDEDTTDRFADSHRLLLPSVPEVLSPISCVIPLQLFSYYLSIGKRLNPDLLHRDDDRYRAARAAYD